MTDMSKIPKILITDQYRILREDRYTLPEF